MSILIIRKGRYSINIVHGVTILVLCILSNHGLHLAKFRENIVNGFRVMERTPFQYYLLQSGIIP